MGAVVLNQNLHLNPSKGPQKLIGNNNDVIEEIGGLIRVYKDGKVERPQIVPCVAASLADPNHDDQLGVVTSMDVVIDKSTNVWARFYVPKMSTAIITTTAATQLLAQKLKIPLLVYFHGGGFCVGSAAWSCYHEFLSNLSTKLSCIIMSVNYRLAPENPLPAAYEDGFKALSWLKRQAVERNENEWWWSEQCDFSKIFLVGDSAGANIAYNLSMRLNSDDAKRLKPLTFKGTVLVQPFFGGESRTESEKFSPRRSALSLAASDTYWRLALPAGATRDHPWCNPMAKGSVEEVSNDNDKILLPMMVCISEMDILKDRNLEFCGALGKKMMKVEYVVYGGVGHAFQILNKSQLSQTRTQEMMAHIKAFIIRY
ncbi:probable carboxylesterase 6 [Humulus lupulus]|uniref:probable carboxylesterase 6 n=1 Tax=Humulus lupulus TaxID=3486 RepID=UPI002B407ED0|nr:probable carboxylesterase 6 [Humulus lupulus]